MIHSWSIQQAWPETKETLAKYMGKKITMRIVKHQNSLPKVQSSSLEVFKPTRQKKIEQPGLASFDQEVRWKTSWGPFKLELSYDLLQILSHCVCCVWQRYSSLISTFLLFVLSSIVICLFPLCFYIFKQFLLL